MRLFRFYVTLRHDRGRVRLATVAQSIAQAIATVCAAEGAPESAVLLVRRGKEIGQ